jgi:hypothetical protein
VKRGSKPPGAWTRWMWHFQAFYCAGGVVKVKVWRLLWHFHARTPESEVQGRGLRRKGRLVL